MDLERADAARLVDGDHLALIVEIGAALLVGEHPEPGVVVGHVDGAGLGAGGGEDLLAGLDEVVPGLDLRGVDAGLLIEIAPIEEDHRTGIPRQRIDGVADGQLRPFERRVGILVFVDAQVFQVDETFGKARPVDFGFAVLDGDDIGQVGAAGSTAGKRLIAYVAVAHIDHADLDVRVFLVEVGHQHVEGFSRDIPAPYGDFA